MRGLSVTIFIFLFSNNLFSFDKRCGKIGLDNRKFIVSIPPLLNRGLVDEKKISNDIRLKLLKQLDVSGYFIIYETQGFTESALEWESLPSINFIGWEREGVNLLIKGRIEKKKNEKFSLRFHPYFVEEGVELKIDGSDVVISGNDYNSKVNNFVNNLLYCWTGRYGIFGTRIVFSKRERPGEFKQIWIMNMDGTDEKKLTDEKKIHILPSWSPKGIAYSVFNDEGAQIFIEGKIFSGYEGSNTGISFSPDGKYAALTLSKDGNMEIYILNGKNGKIYKKITDHPANDLSPTWSPCGEKIAFVSDRSGSPQIYIYDLKNKDLSRLPLPGDYNTSPDWSPSGYEIAYNSRLSGERFGIFLVNINTKEIKMLTFQNENAEEPSFSPDGEYIAFTSNRNGGKKLFIMKRDGRGVKQIGVGVGEYFTPSWEKFFHK